MKTALSILAALFALNLNLNALVVTNDPSINEHAPTDPVSLRCWDYMDSKVQWTAIGHRVFCGVQRVTPTRTITYMGHNYTVEKFIDDKNAGIRFAVVTEAIPSYAPVADSTPTGTANTFPVIVVAGGLGGTSPTDFTWKMGSEKKRWGTATGVRVGLGVFVNWKMEGGNASAAGGDYGGGTFNAAGEFLGPISAANNTSGKSGVGSASLTSWNASNWVGLAIHLVDEYMRPPTSEQ